jgi:hypothetical protein
MSIRVGLALLASGVLLAGCAKQATPTINASMTQIMEPNAQTIWDIASKAFNEKGDGLEASKISDVDWIKVAKSSRYMRDRARILAKTPTELVIAGHDETILGQNASHAGAKGTYDAASVAQIKGLIEGDPKLFAKKATELADAMDALLNAAHRKDAATYYRVSANLDENCDGCHQPFWGTDETPPPPK